MDTVVLAEKPSGHKTSFEYPFLSTAAVFAVSCSVLLLEVTLTRIFSFVMWYHLTYLVISLALLGYGAAGTLLATRPAFEIADYPRTIRRACSLFSSLTVLAVIVAVRFPADPEGVFEAHLWEIVRVALTHLTLAVPFFFAGTAVGFALMRNRRYTNRLYSADLCGAGIGSLVSVLAINHFGAISTIFLAATLPAALAFAASWKDRIANRIITGTLLLLVAGGTLLGVSHGLIPLKISRGKDLTPRQNRVIFTAWNIISRIDVTTPIFERAHFGGRISDAYLGALPWVLPIFQDATAPTALVHVEGRAQDYPLLDYYLQGAPYAVRPRPGSVLVIGIGGGIDALIAERAGARRIVGVDVNPVMIDLLQRRYRNFASGVFRSGDLQLVVSEGRHYVTQSREEFDVIQLSGVDTFAALSAGAFVLTENYLYTVEAIMDLLKRLDDDGVLSYSRWLFTPPRETLKLTVTACEALRRMGMKNPQAHFFIVAGGPVWGRWADLIVKKAPFAAEQLSALRSWARNRQFEIIYDPSEPRPNFFNAYLLSSETARREFIRSYLYDVSPSTDDRPFFFQFYRWKNILSPSAVRGEGGYAPVKMPKGLVSMLLTLTEVLFFSLLLVLLPLESKSVLSPSTRRALPWLAVFAGLGLGFISVEMVLIQKLSVFLGGPAYSMAVTLSSLLVFSGIGSRLSQRLSSSGFASIARVMALLLAVQAVALAFLDFGLPALLGLPHAWRCVTVISAIAPLGLCMGAPFPTLLAKAGEVSPTLVSWAWGVNACATVTGSILATIASLELGFNLTWLIAMGIYLAVLMIMAVGLSQEQMTLTG